MLILLGVAGLKVVYNVDMPAGHRVVSVETLCAACEVPVYSPIQDNHTYAILLNDFMVGGGDGYYMFSANHIISKLFFGSLLYEINSVKLIDVSGIGPYINLTSLESA